MLVAQYKSFISQNIHNNHRSSCHVLRRNGGGLTILMAKRKDFSDKSRRPIFPIRVSTKILARTGITVLGLGFIDAGYSGDWSRIGVISKETEDLLKVAAFVVVPLCIFIGLSFPDESND